MTKLRWLLILCLPVAIFSCKSDISKKAADITQSETPTITLLPAIDTPIPTVTPVVNDFEILFDGEQCSVAGLSETTAGKKVFLFRNTSGKEAYPYICRLDPDKSWTDVVKYSGDPGTWHPEACWCKSQGGSVI